MLARSTQRLVFLIAVIAAVALLIRAWFGPFSAGLSVHSPMNAESILAVCSIYLVCSHRAQVEKHFSYAGWTRRDWYTLPILLAAIVVLCWPSTRVGFVADDYAHILTVAKADSHFFWNQVTVPATDRFFRPASMFSYWLDYQWAGFSPFRWHLAALLWHASNACLVFTLCRLFGLPFLFALFSSVFFGVHGTRPEAITWIAARFDLVATFWVLVALLSFCIAVRRSSLFWVGVVLVANFVALLSKESAYVLCPLLASIVLVRREWRTRIAATAMGCSAVLTMGTFVYRYVLLHGIGGYLDPHGKPTILLLNVWLTFKALALRLWAVLFFPLNWTDPLGWFLKLSITLFVVCLIWLGIRAKYSANARLGLLITILSGLPVQHLLLIGPDLEKSRVVYLGSVGFALLLGAVVQNISRASAVCVSLTFLVFQVSALWHNLATWERVSRIHAEACDTLAGAIESEHSDIAAVAMPNTRDGVYMLKTGLAECVEIRHGIPAARLHNVATMSETAAYPRTLPIFLWDEAEGRVRRASTLTDKP